QRADRPVRLDHLGRPWAALERFDLIITTPQYRLPPRGHIVVCRLPLHGGTPLVLAEARRRWQATLGELPRPRLAVLVGGNSGPYSLYPQTAQGLVQGALAWAKERGGALMLTTSPRTPPKASTALAATLAASGVPYVHYGAAERQRGEPNPYMGFLASAEAILVTGESASMLAEAAATGRPVYIFDLKRAAQGLPLWRRKGGLRSQVVGYHLARRFGPRRMVRDVEILHRHLLAEGNVLYWEDAQTAKGIANGCPTSALDTDPGGQEDLARACRAVRALVTS
ncbi:MAG: ELM1/GtrOC1 family putative glycosyltransferase, partial [Candidatus Competibacterales bacterium]